MSNALPYVLDEIDQRLTQLRMQARAVGVTVLPPLLALGTSERVGSNWLSDTLRPVMPQHNEPFRQQLGAPHPLSPVNPYGVGDDRVPRALLGRLGWHALVESVVAKYAPVRHLVKETNLFFTTRSLLRLFADARWSYSPEARSVSRVHSSARTSITDGGTPTGIGKSSP